MYLVTKYEFLKWIRKKGNDKEKYIVSLLSLKPRYPVSLF